MPTITIGGQIIDIPSSGQSPDWSPPIIQAFQAIEGVLNAFAGPFDVPPQIYTMVSNANGTYQAGGVTQSGVALPNLSFPTTNVRGAFIRYSIFRTTSSTTLSESGNITVTYNPASPVNQKWEIVRETDGDAQVTFGITDVGQVIFASNALSGTGHTGVISYAAQALLQS